MAASNSFINGFAGGLNAMNSMIDAKARRADAEWKKGLIMEDRQFQKEAMDRAEKERQRAKQLRNVNALIYTMQGLDDEAKNKIGHAWADSLNDNSALAQMADNGNPNEVGRYDNFRYAKNDKGESVVVPIMGAYDVKTGKKLRVGDLTSDREHGGSSMGMSIPSFLDFASSQEGVDPLRKAQAEAIRLGGAAPKAYEKWGDPEMSYGQVFSRGDQGGMKSLGRAYGDGDDDGFSSEGSGTWKSQGTEDIEIPDPDDPTKTVTATRHQYYMDMGNGKTKIRESVNYGDNLVKEDIYWAKTNDTTATVPGGTNTLEELDLDTEEPEDVVENPKPAPAAKPAPVAKPVPAAKPAPVVERAARLPGTGYGNFKMTPEMKERAAVARAKFRKEVDEKVEKAIEEMPERRKKQAIEARRGFGPGVFR